MGIQVWRCWLNDMIRRACVGGGTHRATKRIRTMPNYDATSTGEFLERSR
jgi:hypothetical protein